MSDTTHNSPVTTDATDRQTTPPPALPPGKGQSTSPFHPFNPKGSPSSVVGVVVGVVGVVKPVTGSAQYFFKNTPPTTPEARSRSSSSRSSQRGGSAFEKVNNPAPEASAHKVELTKCNDFENEIENDALKTEVNNKKKHFEKMFALSEWLEEERWRQERFNSLAGEEISDYARRVNDRKVAAYKKSRRLYRQWLNVMAVLLDPDMESEFKLAVIQSISTPAQTWLDVVCQRFKAIWVLANWLRLLLLRLKRLFVGAADAISPHLELVKSADQFLSDAYQVLGHLGYIVYFIRLFVYTIPCLMNALIKDGPNGFMRVLKRESESICNDAVWAAVGLTTTFAVHSTVIGTMIVVGLYLFDVLNVLIHGLIRRVKIKAEQTRVTAALEQAVAVMSEAYIALLESIRSEQNQAIIAAAPEALKQAKRLILIRQALKAQEGIAYSCDLVKDLAESERLRVEGQTQKDKMITGLIEASVLLSGMIVTGCGTAIFALTSGIGVAGTTSIAAAVTGAGVAAVMLSPLAIGALALIAAGAVVVMAMCITRVVKQVLKKKAEAKLKALAGKEAPAAKLSIFSKSAEIVKKREDHAFDAGVSIA